jgi:hypothetical protein
MAAGDAQTAAVIAVREETGISKPQNVSKKRLLHILKMSKKIGSAAGWISVRSFLGL